MIRDIIANAKLEDFKTSINLLNNHCCFCIFPSSYSFCSSFELKKIGNFGIWDLPNALGVITENLSLFKYYMLRYSITV